MNEENSLIDVSDFTEEELKKWIFALWCSANGKNSGGITSCTSTYTISIQAEFERSKKTEGQLEFQFLSGKPMGLSFNIKDRIIDCSTCE